MPSQNKRRSGWKIAESAAVLMFAITLTFWLQLLPQTETIKTLEGIYGMALGVGVLYAWARIWEWFA